LGGIALTLTLIVAMPVVSASAASDVTTDAALVDAWDGLMAAKPADFDAALNTLISARDKQGLGNLEAASVALAQLGHQALNSGDIPLAGRYAAAAIKLAPQAPEGYLGLSAVHWSEGSYLAAFQGAFRGVLVGMQHYWVGMAWLGYLAVVIWLAAATAFVVLLWPSLLQGMRTFHHFVRELAFFRAPTWVTGAGVIALALLPIAAGVGPGWTALTWVTLAWLGDRSKLRRVQLFLLLLVLMGPWLCAPLLSVQEPVSGPVGAALAEGRGGFLIDFEHSATAWKPQAAGSWRVAFALGNGALRSGDFDTAINWYRRSRELGGDPVRIDHNIATTHFRAGRVGEAERLYSNLAKSGSVPVLTLLNLGQVQSDRLDFDAARKTLARAQAAGSNRYLDAFQGGEGSVPQVIPFALTANDSRAILLGQMHGWDQFAAALWRVLFGALPVFFAPLLVFVVASLFWLLPNLMSKRRISPCDICHATVCPSCLMFMADLHLCRACGDRFAETQGTEVDVRMLRDRYGNRASELGHRLARWVPGLAALYGERFGVAGFQLFFGALLIWSAALMDTIPEWALGAPQDGWPVIRLALLVVFVLYVAWHYLITADWADDLPTADGRG